MLRVDADVVVDAAQHADEGVRHGRLPVDDQRWDGDLLAVVARSPAARRVVSAGDDGRFRRYAAGVEHADRERAVRRGEAKRRSVVRPGKLSAEPLQSETASSSAENAIDDDPQI